MSSQHNSFPKPIACVPDSRKALAPYNFVELPDQVIKAQALPDGDRYHPDRYTGKIECTLTTESPLYIRCGLTLDEFKQGKESKDLPDFFYISDKLKPVIPGSSIRGMLRTLVEIVSFGKIDRVSGRQKFFFRAVAAKRDDPLATPYKTSLKNVKAGYLVKQNDGWYIRPAKTAASAEDFIAESLKDSKIFDFADAIFGFVRDSKQEKGSIQAASGRISISDAFISDAICQQSDSKDIWLSDNPIVPKILSGPKPTTFQHYLVQTEADKPKLKHYGSKPGKETVIRGHKLYWHKGKKPAITLENPEEVSDTQKTKIKPIKLGVNFQFSIHFENLSEIELGALLWVLDIAQDEKYRLSLGMGKPLGMGAVKITHQLYLNQRQKRYEKLFDGEQWLTGYSAQPDSVQPYIDVFDAFIRREIGATESSLKEVRRIKMLLAMLSWDEAPPADQTRYLEIERDANLPHIGTPKNGKVNEYANRPVLPTPLQVIGWENCNDEDNNPNSGDSGGGNSPKPNSPKSGKGNSPQLKPKKSSSGGTGKTSMAAAFERATQRPKRP